MKKIVLSLAVVAVFVFYSIHTRTDGANAKVMLPTAPKSTASNDVGTAQPAPNSSDTNGGTNPTPSRAAGQYKDGTYTGSAEDAFYGIVQVQAVIQNGKIANVEFLQRPNDNPTTRAINDQADPYLVQEAIQAQSAHVDTITGATDTSLAFVQSLTVALSHAG